LIARRSSIPVSATAIAWSAAMLGDLDAAFEWLERAVEERDQLIVFLDLYTDRYAPSLLTDRRYPALLARVGLGHGT
jgi:hypothetical protein